MDQVIQLKLNVTNIKSYLISSNNKLKKLRIEKSNLIASQQDLDKKQKKEKNIESPSKELGPFGKAVGGIANSIMKGPLSFFDKIKEFFGLILTGIIVNNLPYMIDQIKGFFDKNRWILDGTKFILDAVGAGIMGIINLVEMFSPSKQESLTKDARNLNQGFTRLDGELNDDNVQINKRLSELQKEQTSANQTPPPPSQSPPPTTSIKEERTPTPPPVTNQKRSDVPKFASGGKVKADTGTQPTARKNTVTNTTSESVRSKKAVQTVNYFSYFNNNNKASEEIAEKDSRNKNTFKDILTTLKTIQDIRKIVSDDETPSSPSTSPSPSQPPSPPGPPGPDGGTPVDVNPNEVIGKIGTTGKSTGPHLHIETGDGWSGAGGNLSESILNGVFINKIPLSRITQGDRLGANRGHKGFDFPANSGSPITLGPGLKFLEYSSGYNAGYGNVTIIVDENGKKYLLGHLSEGPSNPQALQKKQNETRTSLSNEFGNGGGGPLTGQASWYGPGFYGNRTANGEILREGDKKYTAAHKTLPFGTRVKVTNLANGKTITVRINDRGPYHGNRIMDLNKSARDALGGADLMNIKMEIVQPTQQRASLTPAQTRPIIGEDVDSSSVAFIQPYIVNRNILIPQPFPIG